MRSILETILAPICARNSAVIDRICDAFSSIYAIAEAPIEQIADALDGDMSTSIYIKLTFALASRRITDEYKVGKRYTDVKTREYLKARLFGMVKEGIVMLSYDSGGKFLGSDNIGVGTVNLSTVTPRRAIDIAVRRGARSVILAHNHPGGEAQPSDDDICSNELLKRAFSEASIEYIGHYIVACNECIAIESGE